VASETDTEALLMAAKRLAEIVELSEVLQEEGRIIESFNPKTQQTMSRSHPGVGQLNEAMRHLQSLLSEFGLTPAARSKVVAKQTKGPNARFQRRAS
jgi:P27 family predicted phage terminase small subunit